MHFVSSLSLTYGYEWLLKTKIDMLRDPSKSAEEKQDMYLQLECDRAMACFVAKMFQAVEGSMARFFYQFHAHGGDPDTLRTRN